MLDNISQLNKLKELPSILLMFGEEDFLLDEALEKLLETLVPNEEAKFDFEMLDGDDSTYERITDSCSAYPFISPRRVVVVRNFDKITDKGGSKKNSENPSFNKYLALPQTTTILILVSKSESIQGISSDLKSKNNQGRGQKKLQTAKFPYNILFNQYEWIEFSKVWESSFSSWVLKRFKEKGKDIGSDAIEFLVANTTPTLRDLNSEIDKINLFSGSRKMITYEDVANVSGCSRVHNVFELQKAIGKRNLTLSIDILQNMLAYEKQEMLILTILARFFISMWKLLEANAPGNDNFKIAELAGISPFFVTEYKEYLAKYKFHEIERAIKIITKTDEKLKSSSVSTLFLLEKMIIKIMD